MGRPRSAHCVENHGEDRPRLPAGDCRTCRNERQSARWARKSKWVADHKLSRGCSRCGYAEHPNALHLHHRDPAQKEMAVSRAIGFSWERLRAEVGKCDVLCANCHSVLHARG